MGETGSTLRLLVKALVAAIGEASFPEEIVSDFTADGEAVWLSSMSLPQGESLSDLDDTSYEGDGF